MPPKRNEILRSIETILAKKIGIIDRIDTVAGLKKLLPGLADEKLRTIPQLQELLNKLESGSFKKSQIQNWLEPVSRIRKKYRRALRSKLSIEEITARWRRGDRVVNIAKDAQVSSQAIYKILKNIKLNS